LRLSAPACHCCPGLPAGIQSGPVRPAHWIHVSRTAHGP
jgi:hypothetical protein